eukprot:g64165.t1
MQETTGFQPMCVLTLSIAGLGRTYALGTSTTPVQRQHLVSNGLTCMNPSLKNNSSLKCFLFWWISFIHWTISSLERQYLLNNTMALARSEGARIDERTRLRSPDQKEPLLDVQDDQQPRAPYTPTKARLIDNKHSAWCKRPKLMLGITLCIFALSLTHYYLPANDGSGEESIEHSASSKIAVAIVKENRGSSYTDVSIAKEGSKVKSPYEGKGQEAKEGKKVINSKGVHDKEAKEGKQGEEGKGTKDKEAKEGEQGNKGKGTKRKTQGKKKSCTKGPTCEIPADLQPGFNFLRNWSLGFNGMCGDFDETINFHVTDFPPDVKPKDFDSTLPYKPNALVTATVQTLTGPAVLSWAAVVVVGAVTGSFNSLCTLDGYGVCEGASLILQALVSLGSATLLDQCIFGIKSDSSGTVQNCPGFEMCLEPTDALAVAQAEFVLIRGDAPFHVTGSLDPGDARFGDYKVLIGAGELGDVTTDGYALRLQNRARVSIQRLDNASLAPIGKFYPNAKISVTFVQTIGTVTFTWDSVIVSGRLTAAGDPACVKGLPEASNSCSGFSVLLRSTSDPKFWDNCSFVIPEGVQEPTRSNVLVPIICPQIAPLVNGNGKIPFEWGFSGRRRLACACDGCSGCKDEGRNCTSHDECCGDLKCNFYRSPNVCANCQKDGYNGCAGNDNVCCSGKCNVIQVSAGVTQYKCGPKLSYGNYLFDFPGLINFTDPTITYCSSYNARGFFPNYYTNSLVPCHPYSGCTQFTTFTDSSLEGNLIFQSNDCDDFVGGTNTNLGLGFYQTVQTAPGIYKLVVVSDACPLRKAFLQNASSRFVEAEPCRYRYYKFSPNSVRGQILQLAELQLFKLDRWLRATDVDGSCGNFLLGFDCADGEFGPNANDDNLYTQWQNYGNLPLIYDFKVPTEIDEYNWMTANNNPEKDSIRWRLEGSDDAKLWRLLDDRSGSDQTVTTSRSTWTAPGASKTLGYPLRRAYTYRYYRFVSVKNRGYVVQLAEFQLFRSDSWKPAANVDGNCGPNVGELCPSGEEGRFANDGIEFTKWLNYYSLPLVYDHAEPTEINEYNWMTANDFAVRDSLRWTLEGSNDVNKAIWTVLDDRTRCDQIVTKDRRKWAVEVEDEKDLEACFDTI